jgi:hypothetical protein
VASGPEEPLLHALAAQLLLVMALRYLHTPCAAADGPPGIGLS